MVMSQAMHFAFEEREHAVFRVSRRWKASGRLNQSQSTPTDQASRW